MPLLFMTLYHCMAIYNCTWKAPVSPYPICKQTNYGDGLLVLAILLQMVVQVVVNLVCW